MLKNLLETSQERGSRAGVDSCIDSRFASHRRISVSNFHSRRFWQRYRYFVLKKRPTERRARVRVRALSIVLQRPDASLRFLAKFKFRNSLNRSPSLGGVSRRRREKNATLLYETREDPSRKSRELCRERPSCARDSERETPSRVRPRFVSRKHALAFPPRLERQGPAARGHLHHRERGPDPGGGRRRQPTGSIYNSVGF